MIVCKDCGEHNADGTAFCGRCGTFLEFEGERIAEQPAAGTPAQPDPASTQPDPQSAQPGRATAAPAAPTGPDTPASQPDAASAKPDSTSGTLAEEPEPAAAVATRQPDEVRRRPRGRAPRRVDTLPSGSLICGQCATGNDPARRFCLTCGNPLAGAAVVARPPFWRRVLFRERTYVAGSRRKVRHGGRFVARVVVVVVILAAIVLLVGPLRPAIVGLYQSIAGTVSGPQQIRPASVTASASAPGHPATLAFDGASNTYWAAPARAAAPTLHATLADPADVVVVGITPGVSLNTPEYLAGPRPTVVEISAMTSSGPKAMRFPLDPNPGFRKIPVDLPGAKAVTVTVVSATGDAKSASGAITEVELYAKP